MSFLIDLKRGQDAEAKFHTKFPTWQRTDGRRADFIMPDGRTVELKTESRTTKETPNLALELESSPGKPGAIERAVRDGVTFIIYWFADDKYFVYQPSTLLAYLTLHNSKHRIIKVRNATYFTTVCLVPRDALKEFEMSVLDLSTNSLLNSTNLDYHSNRSHLSSSNLKTLLKSPEQFHAEWILNKKQVEIEKPAFSEGSFVHSLILEPDKLAQYAIYPGLRKAGAAYESFASQNPGKTILSAAQVNRCEQLASNYSKCKVAVDLLQNGAPEYTMLSTILDVPVKCRADYIVIGKYIVDIKTTSMPTDADVFRATVAQYGYELSAALYCQIAYDNTQKLHDFYWVVISKVDNGVGVYKASSATLSLGSSLVTQALVQYKKCLASGIWIADNKVEISDEIIEI